MSVLLIKHYDRGADLHAIKQFFHFVLWCIDTAVGTGSLVDVPAEFFAPSGVMNTDTPSQASRISQEMHTPVPVRHDFSAYYRQN